ncbi:hypothetical protein X801_02741 [Opisthorchis viverrini]|uniref:Uncharacterized protein n=1 Tax=Opisthorchis viverrini TaxID=6198 RepID=A0A1S8X4I0_OPIVI|nr:hypothetical protein X801_02741 [Opisthorchis viverrini]
MRWILVFTTLFIAYKIRAYVKMDYPDYCFYDAMRFDEDTGFYIFLNPVKRDRYNITESQLLSTNVMRLDFGFVSNTTGCIHCLVKGKCETDTLNQLPVDEGPYKLKKLINNSCSQSENVLKALHEQLRLTMG